MEPGRPQKENRPGPVWFIAGQCRAENSVHDHKRFVPNSLRYDVLPILAKTPVARIHRQALPDVDSEMIR